MALMLCGAARLPGQSAVQEELGRIERLRKVYQDPGQEPLERARALEQIIAAYEELVGSESKRPRTVRQILDGEIKWRLILAELLVAERARQGRFAVEELGLGGDWAKDLSGTLDRLDLLLKQTNERIEQLGRHMRADAGFERNYVVTGLNLQVSRARIKVDYYRGWVCFYRAILSKEQVERKRLLEAAIEHLRRGGLRERPGLGDKAMLLMSKALRRLGRMGEADKLLSWLEGQGLDEQSAYQVGLERCRLLRDRGYHDTALAGLQQMRKWCRGKRAFEQLPVDLTLAYLQCSIQAAKAAKLAEDGDIEAAGRISRWRVKPLAEIFRAQKSEQIRSIIYEQLRKTRLADASGTAVAALELLAVGVGLAEQGNTAAALKCFDELLSRTDSAGRDLHAEALWQAGKAGQEKTPLRACNYLGRLADEFGNSAQAEPGLILAVQISAKLCQDRPDEQAAEQVCFEALGRLMSRYPAGKQAKHWRFYWAGLLSKRGELAKAAEQFGQISKEHPRYVQARYYQLDLRRQLLNGQAAPGRAQQYARLAREYLALDSYVRSGGGPAGHGDETARRFGARARLEAVRIFCVELNEPETALLRLGSFSPDFAGDQELQARARRYRAVALAELGRLGEAGRLSMQLLRDDPTQAMEIADVLLRLMEERFADLTSDDLSAQDKELAERWMKLARARLELTQKSDLPTERKAQTIVAGKQMLGRAMFVAGELDEALDVFEGLERSQPNSAEYIRIVGKILLAQKKYDAAAGRWQQLVRGLRQNSPAWFEAWYWLLRTNFEAGGDREKIARRIKQLQALDKQMGSAETLARFEGLLAQTISASKRMSRIPLK